VFAGEDLMIRVTTTERVSGSVVAIEGDLSGDGIAVVEACCQEAGSNGKPVQLFLRDVVTVDAAGLMLLRRLAAKGVRLRASGIYTSWLVHKIGRGGGTVSEPCLEM
jgi:hypothetical protein